MPRLSKLPDDPPGLQMKILLRDTNKERRLFKAKKLKPPKMPILVHQAQFDYRPAQGAGSAQGVGSICTPDDQLRAQDQLMTPPSDRAQLLTNGSDRAQLLTNGLDRSQLLNGPDRAQLLMTNGPDRAQLLNGPDRAQLLANGPDRAQLLANGPDRAQMMSSGPGVSGAGQAVNVSAPCAPQGQSTATAAHNVHASAFHDVCTLPSLNDFRARVEPAFQVSLSFLFSFLFTSSFSFFQIFLFLYYLCISTQFYFF